MITNEYDRDCFEHSINKLGVNKFTIDQSSGSVDVIEDQNEYSSNFFLQVVSRLITVQEGLQDVWHLGEEVVSDTESNQRGVLTHARGVVPLLAFHAAPVPLLAGGLPARSRGKTFASPSDTWWCGHRQNE